MPNYTFYQVKKRKNVSKNTHDATMLRTSVYTMGIASITILLNTWFSLYNVHKTKQTQQQVLDISGQEWWTRAVTTVSV